MAPVASIFSKEQIQGLEFYFPAPNTVFDIFIP